MDTTPTSPIGETPSTTTPPPPWQHPNTTASPETLALHKQIESAHSPDALITLLNTLPPSHPIPIDYPNHLLKAAEFRTNHPSRIPILFARLVDVVPPEEIQPALLRALSAACRTLNVPGARELLRLGADPWADDVMGRMGDKHPLLLAVGQVFPLRAGDGNPCVAVGSFEDLREVGRGAEGKAEMVKVWRGEVEAIAVHLGEMVEGVLLRGVPGEVRGRAGFKGLMRRAQERYLVALRRMVIKGVVGMGVEGVVQGTRGRKFLGEKEGVYTWDWEGIWWKEGLSAAGLRKRLREEGMKVDEGLVEVWNELVRVGGGVLVARGKGKGKGKASVEGEMGLYVLLVEGQGGKYTGPKEDDIFF